MGPDEPNTSPPPGLPTAADPERACLRRIPFTTPENEDGRLVARGRYRTDSALGPQRFEIAVSAEERDERDLLDLIRHFRASFEAIALDPAFLDAPRPEPPEQMAEEEDEEGRKDKWAPGIDIDIELVLEERPPDGELPVLCGFYVDPGIDVNTPPHRYKPSKASTIDVQMHVEEGTARVRVFSGSTDTGRYQKKKAVDDTRWLDTQVDTPRVHVRGLENGSYYWLRGGWTQIDS